MTETQFISQNEEKWNKLDAFNKTLQQKGLRALSQMEIKAFAEVFRSVSYHHAYAKTHFPKGSSLPYLSNIVGVAHNYYYVREKRGFTEITDYLFNDFPQAVIGVLRYVVLATIIFMVGTIFAYAYVATDISRFNQIFPFEFTRQNLGEGEVVWDYALMSAVIMTNNIRVAIMAFVFGITAGIGTVWILFYNGMILGSLAAYISVTGVSRDTLIFWSLILPHGVPELMAIFLSGACGIMIGKALLIPGSYSRKDSVIHHARQSAVLVPGIVLLLILAALVEGFFTPLGISPYFKLGFAFLTLIGLLLYFAKGYKVVV